MSPLSLKDRVVVVTGASRGVGAAVAVACAKEGAKLVLAAKTVEPDPRLPGTLLDTKRMVEAEGAEAEIVQFDARDAEQCDGVIRAAVARFGRVDVLVNNAGAIFWAPVADWPQKKFDLVFGVNVRASFALAHAAIPYMRKQGFGHILMMSPPIVTGGAVGKAPYLVSKLGMTLLAMAIDAEEKEHGIAAHALWPVAAIKTAATVNLGMGDDAQWRKVDILSEATVALLKRDPRACAFRAWLDEEVLAEEGVTDFTRYRCVPDVEPPPMSIELIDPGWGARMGRS
ncbi:MAG: SDR family oxidoreductase [Pseudomonadota bacterium]|nr:SDR family oxidoreductase [Pseudomonadota bacterium]